MTIQHMYFVVAVFVGLGATLIMDIWALIMRRAFNISLPNYCFVGRWLCYMPAGTFMHTNIATTPKIPAECATGWIAHYLTGICYALLLFIPASGTWFIHPTLLPALAVGITTVLIPYFIMQPSFGLGMAAAKTPRPNQARLRSLMAHTSFGFGLYLSACPLSYMLRAFT